MDLNVKSPGLNAEQVITSRNKSGSNNLQEEKQTAFWHSLKEVVLEPMFILLLSACILYFILQKYQEGIIMLLSIFLVAGISLFQEYRSRNAIQALNKLSAAKAKVIRNGIPEKIPTEEIVVDDLLLLEEGELVGADGLIIKANDFSLNESILTGESLSVQKDADQHNEVYRGTLVVSGSAQVKVTAVGVLTKFGKIGTSLQEITVVKTPMQIQIRAFVRNMVWIGAAAFVIVVGFNYFQSHNFIQSFLQGLTLAMSILPEEIPVAFSTFQALGAFRLLKSNVIVKQPQYVETLGSATVICADKTGTLTQNKMSIEYLFNAANNTSYHLFENIIPSGPLVEYAMWSSETHPFDPMEKAIHKLYEKHTAKDKRPLFQQVHEYPIGGKPPMMTHIFRNSEGETIIAAKGAPEAILRRSNLSKEDQLKFEEQSLAYAREGYRVLGVGKGIWANSSWPASQEEFMFEFIGLVAFQDPPKSNIRETIETFRKAGISVKMITGDYAETALAIAGQVGLSSNAEVLTGKDILEMQDEQLAQKVKQVNVYARMFPEAKMKVINALKNNGEVVAMTGDGVNDAPALKAAHIGIAMGKRGSEVARSAASLILTDDDLAHMTEAIALGRKIYNNLKKAIQYIVSIHIPIILIVVVPLLLSWKYTNIFSPVHVIFLELIMGPTCSIIYENEPMEPGTMLRPPRIKGENFLSLRQLMLSIIQGLLITAGCLGIGFYFMQRQEDEASIRAIIFVTLLFCNIFLTLVNRSFYYSIFTSISNKNRLVPLIIGTTLILIVSVLYIPFVRNLFSLNQLPLFTVSLCFLTGMLFTCWLEIWKWFRRRQRSLVTNSLAQERNL